MIDEELHYRIDTALEKSLEAFWKAARSEFPEIKAGNLDRELSLEFAFAARKAIKSWVEINENLQEHEGTQ
jgi:hypothetical protein